MTSTSNPAAADISHRLPLFCVRPDGQLEMATLDRRFQAAPGDRVISFVLAG